MATVLPQLEGAARFRLISKIGEGGMGVVYEAFDEDRGIPVALKTLRRVSPTALYLFKQEFRSIAGIAHPNLVALYELFGGSPENWFFTMQLLRGTGLMDFVRSDCFPPSFEMTAAGDDLESPTSGATSPFEQPTSDYDTLSTQGKTLHDPRNLLARGTAPDSDLIRQIMRQVVDGISA